MPQGRFHCQRDLHDAGRHGLRPVAALARQRDQRALASVPGDGRAGSVGLMARVSSAATTGGTNEDKLLEWIPRLRRYARALVANKDEADDLVQDTLERAWAKIGLWEEVRDMSAWLLSIMHNIRIDALRRKRIETVEMGDETPEVPVEPSHHDRRSLQDLERALAKLPPDQREVLLLVGLEEMSYAEAALTLHMPVGTVMSRLSRGRERLRALMAMRRPGALRDV